MVSPENRVVICSYCQKTFESGESCPYCQKPTTYMFLNAIINLAASQIETKD